MVNIHKGGSTLLTLPKIPLTIPLVPPPTAISENLAVAAQEKDTTPVQQARNTGGEPVVIEPREELDAPAAVAETTKSEPDLKICGDKTVTIAQETDTAKIELLVDPPQRIPSLENLPPELRLYLLSMIELDCLQSLIHASPVYYQQYKQDRERLLCRSLESTLGSVTIDAYTVNQSNTVEFSKQRTAEKIDQLLQSYRELRSQPPSAPLNKMLDTEGIMSMIKFHCKTVQPLVRNFTTQALNSLAEKTKHPRSHNNLTRTEEVRLMRAFYRYQLCCNLYGLGRSYILGFEEAFCFDEAFHFNADYSTSDCLLRDFLCIFDPWEAEEIACVSRFCQEKYEGFFDEIQWDLDEQNPKFDGQRPPTPPGAFSLQHCVDRESYLKSLTSRGLELLHFFVFKIEDHEHLVSTMQKCITRCLGDFLQGFGSPFRESPQWDRHCDQPGDRDHKQGRHEPFTFQGDKQPNGCHVFPPLAWTLVFGGTYSNIFGEYIPDKFQKWGWVMWDAARLERMGAKDVLVDQWELWGDRREEYWDLD